MNLFLFTNFFPFKKAEPFLVNEFEFTKKNFEHISVFALYGNDTDLTLQQNEKLAVLTPPIASFSDKKKLFTKGLFNSAPAKFHINEFFEKKVFLSPKKLYWFLISLFVTRTILASPSYNQLVQAVNAARKPVLYFYWGDNFCWIIPYLCEKITNKEVKIVVRFHGTDLYEHLKNDYAPLRPAIVKHADLLVPVSEFGKEYLQHMYPQAAYKVFLSRLGVFDHGLNPYAPGDVKHIISVSNVVAVKRIHLIFEALQQTYSKIVWHHFGDGPLLQDLKDSLSEKRAGLEVIFHGHVNNKTLMDFYTSQPLSLILNVSASEGLPVSIMEAFSFGVPAIATNVGGTSELVSEKTGYLIPAGFEIMVLAERIEKLLRLEAPDAEQLRKNARSVFEDKVSAEKNYEAFYRKILEV